MPTTEQSARASSSAATIPVPVATSSTRWPGAGATALTSARRQRGSCQKLSAADSASYRRGRPRNSSSAWRLLADL